VIHLLQLASKVLEGQINPQRRGIVGKQCTPDVKVRGRFGDKDVGVKVGRRVQ
jgi:hypothetical protein